MTTASTTLDHDRDAVALLGAVHTGDRAGVEAIARHGNFARTALTITEMYLATLSTVVGSPEDVDADLAAVLADLAGDGTP